MKKYYKKPNFYYILTPILVALLALLVWGVSLPISTEKLNKKRVEFDEAEDQITKILELDPERLEYENQQGQAAEFDYTEVINKFAQKCGISPSDYSLITGREMTRRGRKSKTADVKIDNVGIEQFAKFLSLMLLYSSDLQCDQLKLTKVKAAPDIWKANLKFTYYD